MRPTHYFLQSNQHFLGNHWSKFGKSNDNQLSFFGLIDRKMRKITCKNRIRHNSVTSVSFLMTICYVKHSASHLTLFRLDHNGVISSLKSQINPYDSTNISITYLPYTPHYKPRRLAYFLPQFSLRFIIESS